MKKSLDFEINLLPVISLLAVCISFLLLTTVWIHLASLDITQAHGTESSSEEENKKNLWITFESSGQLLFEVKDQSGKSFFKETSRSGQDKKTRDQLRAQIAKVTEEFAQLNSTILRPHAQTPYENIILLMDLARESQLKEIGIAPL